MSIRLVHIANERPVEVSAEYLIFDGRDAEGALRILVSILRWEHLQAEAPHYCDSDDRRDHALGLIEAASARMIPARSSTGFRYVMLD